MKTYFIAGYSQFSDGMRWSFARVWEEDEGIHPSKVFLDKGEELENSQDNYRSGNRGELVVTTFNAV